MYTGSNSIGRISNDYENVIRSLGSGVDVSFVIPVYNEVASISELVCRISLHVPSTLTFEIILIDDGSTDDSWAMIQALAEVHNDVRGLRFRSNRGKAAGLQAGFNAARGEIIFTMDGDLQDDPREIPNFLDKLSEGYDLVTGWKKIRHDPWHKVLPSRVFNRMLSYFSQVKLHDHNCGFKCYRRSVAKSLQLFGELHRMVPSLAGIHGFRVAEIPVRHHPRKHGVSKYGFERFIRGFSDMLTIGFLRKYRERPSHFANTWAGIYLFLAGILFVVSIVAGLQSLQGLLICAMGLGCGIVSSACFLSGLFAELMIRHNRKQTPCHVAEETRALPQNASVELTETSTSMAS